MCTPGPAWALAASQQHGTQNSLVFQPFLPYCLYPV